MTRISPGVDQTVCVTVLLCTAKTVALGDGSQCACSSPLFFTLSASFLGRYCHHSPSDSYLSLYPLTSSCFAYSMNRTIDDTYGDLITQRQVVYSTGWHAGQNCSVCAVTPSRAQAYGNTWHITTSNMPDSTTSHTAAFQFNGLS